MVKRIQILVFMAMIAAVLYITNDYWAGWFLTFFSIFMSVSAVFIGFMIFMENRNPRQTLNWIIVLAAFPVIGFLFYLFFGQNYRKRKMFAEKAELDEQAIRKIEGNRTISETEWEKAGEHQKLLLNLAQKMGSSPISFDTETKVLTNGAEAFPAMLEAIKQAKHHIHLEFYIVRNDQIGKELKDLLIQKAGEGVEVRFLYDAVGSWKLSKQFKDELLSSGVNFVPFSPVKLPFLNNKINFRNHRKIIVIDGKEGFVGGLNIGDEYLGRNPYYGNWRDTHLYLKGEAVRSLQLIFLRDWFYMTGKSLLKQSYLSTELSDVKSDGGVQLIAGGPDGRWEVIKNVFFSMIVSAKHSIWIASPYFIPDEDILTALKVAALSGLDVRLLVPSRPDKRIVFYASRSYFLELLEAGVKIYEYQEGFMHSKIIIVDNELASIGTANMDMRSFHLNFEVNAFLYKTASTRKLVSDFSEDVHRSTELKFRDFRRRPVYKRLLESTCRLLSPLL